MKRSAVIVLTGALFLGLAVPAGAKHSWRNYHWSRGSNPFTVTLGDNVATKWDTYLTTASSKWTLSQVLDTNVTAGQADNVQNCTPPNGRIEVCNDTYGSNGWLGLARIWLADADGHIQKGQVLLNDSYFDTATYNKAAARQHVMCQEIGHGLGLDHQKSRNAKSCMNDLWGLFSADYQHPNQHDYDQLSTIYGHTDGSGARQANGRRSSSYSRTWTDADGTRVVEWVVPA